MFYYFNGEVTLLESNLAVVDCGGVGYACRTSSYTLSRLHVGERARLYTYCSIRESVRYLTASARARSCGILNCCSA